MKWTGERAIPLEMKGNSPTHQEQLDRIKTQHLARYNWAKDKVEGTVLDAACGAGYGTEILGQGHIAYGVDISKEAVEYAKTHYKGTFSVCDLECSFADGAFDTIVSFETIEHLKNPNPFLTNVKNTCRKFIFSIPLNNPSEYHLQVYSLPQAQALIKKYFNQVEWYQQDFEEITPFQKEAKFLIGIAYAN